MANREAIGQCGRDASQAGGASRRPNLAGGRGGGRRPRPPEPRVWSRRITRPRVEPGSPLTSHDCLPPGKATAEPRGWSSSPLNGPDQPCALRSAGPIVAPAPAGGLRAPADDSGNQPRLSPCVANHSSPGSLIPRGTEGLDQVDTSCERLSVGFVPFAMQAIRRGFLPVGHVR